MKLLIVCSVVLLVFLTKTNAVGDLQEMNTNDAELQSIVEFAEVMLDRAVNSLYTHKIGNIIKAQKQIVSGVKYYLDFEFKETNCVKNKPNNGVCDTTKTEICSVEVWSQPWVETNKLSLVTFSCKSN